MFLFQILSIGFLATPAISSQLQTPIVEQNACNHPPYQIHIFSSSPLVLYIKDFLTSSERAHLLEISKNTFISSSVADSAGKSGSQKTRTSKSTSLPGDEIVDCVTARAAAIQSPALALSHIEPLQLVAYTANQSYHHHTDWFTSPALATPQHGGNRMSSFFAYVDVEPGTTGGGTNFPVLDAPKGEEWCAFVDCDREWEEGVTFRPIVGNAVFWKNMEGGVGDERTLHAGLPVTGGGKVGLNIWTREGVLGKEFRVA